MTRPLSFFRRLLREPTLHFTVLAGTLFVISALVRSAARPVIVLDSRAISWRIAEIERGRGDRLTADERLLAESAYIDEQVLAREARLRGLDDDDRIRSILSQKMLQVLSAEVVQPSDAELEAYYRDNRERYAVAAAASLEDVVLLGAERTLAAVIRNDEKLEELTRAGWLTRTPITRATLPELSWSLGNDTARAVFQAQPGDWIGPERTDRGERWLHIIDRFDPAPPPPLDSIRDQVRFDWISKREGELLKQRISDLRRRYSIEVIDQGPEE
jgi:hypothetical protein